MPKQLISEDPETANTMSSSSSSLREDGGDEETRVEGKVELTTTQSDMELVTMKVPRGRSITTNGDIYPILKRASRSFGKKIRPRSMSGDVYVDDDDEYEEETRELQPKKTVRMSERDEEAISKNAHLPGPGSRFQQGLRRIFQRRLKKEETETAPHRTRKRKKNDDFVVVLDHDSSERITYLRGDSSDAVFKVSVRQAFEESRKDITTNKLFWIDFQNANDVDAIVKGFGDVETSFVCFSKTNSSQSLVYTHSLQRRSKKEPPERKQRNFQTAWW